MTGTTTDWFSASEAVGDAGLEAASVTGILALDPAISRSLLVDRGRGCHDRSLRGLDGQQEVALKTAKDLNVQHSMNPLDEIAIEKPVQIHDCLPKGSEPLAIYPPKSIEILRI
ncbi:hypothetical protein C8R42DRAFT_715674 [Lentinula raphanica]|nr:hypothetical protein C8R42DRAFT_715674 [Lentinula raphanica]